MRPAGLNTCQDLLGEGCVPFVCFEVIDPDAGIQSDERVAG